MTSARLAALLILLLPAWPRVQPAQAPAPPPVEAVAEGVRLFRLDDPALLDPEGPVSVRALRLDPKKVRLEMAVAETRDPARETVESIANRRHAIAAVNAGFFVLTDGRPAAMLKVAGQLLGGTSRARGAIAFTERRGATRLLFDRVTVDKRGGVYRTLMGSSPKDWARAGDAVSGAGLLLLKRRVLSDWTDETITAGFDTTRHPRTVIGEGGGAIWLLTVDGRQPGFSLGMTFVELQALARRFGLESALNLDGGGSTTMVVAGHIVNRPSDPTGPRPVSDAIVVLPRIR
jgi:hypothetical protein